MIAAVGAHELLVLATGAIGPSREPCVFAGAVPVNDPGVKLIVTSSARTGVTAGDRPYSSRHAVTDAIVVFDEVVVPNERIFAPGELDRAPAWRESFEMWERFFTLGRLVDFADALVGLAHLVAEANGLSRVAHIREKIGNMTVFTTVLAATLEAQSTAPPGHPRARSCLRRCSRVLGASMRPRGSMPSCATFTTLPAGA